MSDQRNGGIAWCDETWNPVRGCSRVSEGCRNCYAETMAARFSGPGQPYAGLARRAENGEARWTGEVRLVPERLADPLRWQRPRRIFVNSMSDLFHEKLSNQDIAAVFGVMAFASRHTFLVLTKRPERMRRWFQWLSHLNGPPLSDGAGGEKYLPACDPLLGVELQAARRVPALTRPRSADEAPRGWPLPNVWIGVSVEDQNSAAQRILHLFNTPAAVRWASYEPALGKIDWRDFLKMPWMSDEIVRPGSQPIEMMPVVGLDWIVVGGESGPGARDFAPEWARTTLTQCRTANVPVFIKQMGAAPRWCERCMGSGSDVRFVPADGTVPGWIPCRDCDGNLTMFHDDPLPFDFRLKHRAGADPAEWPEELRVREWPAVRS